MADQPAAGGDPGGVPSPASGPGAASSGGAVELRDAGPMIVATVRLPAADPGRALAAFTDPVVLARWWRGELTAQLVTGGEYVVAFPAIGARLAGRVLSYSPGRLLEFSWAWDGGDGPPSAVSVRAERSPEGRGAVLTIEHGPHGGDEASQKGHAEHWEGWEFFLPRLVAAISRRPETFHRFRARTGIERLRARNWPGA